MELTMDHETDFNWLSVNYWRLKLPAYDNAVRCTCSA